MAKRLSYFQVNDSAAIARSPLQLNALAMLHNLCLVLLISDSHVPIWEERQEKCRNGADSPFRLHATHVALAHLWLQLPPEAQACLLL